MKKALLRIIDANINRSREGLRVCEEIVRFVLNDAKLTAEFKNIRHRISENIKRFPGEIIALLACRQSNDDVGKNLRISSKRKGYRDVFGANIQRTKESLRVLEEFSKIFSQTLSGNFSRLRFKVYELEKKTTAKL